METEFSFFVPSQFHGVLSTITFWDFIDIFLVAIILYKLYEMLENTRAITLIKGLLVLLGISFACSILNLHAISWLLQKVIPWLFVALPIVFQPELRRALEHLGQGRFFGTKALLEDEGQQIAAAISEAVLALSKTRTGALIVIEREVGLDDLKGIRLDAKISKELLCNIFVTNSPLHDGAVILRGQRILSAQTILPLTTRSGLASELGTRHRAGIGVTEQSDAFVVIVSEETGKISIAEYGKLDRGIQAKGLTRRLLPMFTEEKETFRDMFENWRKAGEKK